MGYIQFLAWLTSAGIRIAQPVAKRAFDAWVKTNKKLPTKKNFTQIANSAKNIAKPDKLAEIRSKMAAAQKVRDQNKILPFRYKKSMKQEFAEMKPTTVEDFIKKGDWDPSGMASGGIAGQLHLNQGGRIGFRLGKGPGQRIQEQEILNERIRHFFEQQLPHEDQPINREVNQSFLDALQGQDKGTTGLRYRGEVVEFDDGSVYYKDTGEYYKQDGTQVEGPSEGAKIIPETIEVKEGGKVSSGLAHILGV